jgi:hypothetical protein
MEKILKIRKFIVALAVSCILALPGCVEGDGELDYGFAHIYIPQATVSGGLNNHYPVPSGRGKDTYNFAVENGKLNIYLAVLRSGKIANAAGFSVNIVVSNEMTDEAIASGEIADALALPSGLYTIPNRATVEAGNSSTTFFLAVDIEALMNGAYDGKKLALAVAIENPTNYELNTELASVVVVINVDAMRPILFPEP